jgi:hypothetical protein
MAGLKMRTGILCNVSVHFLLLHLLVEPFLGCIGALDGLAVKIRCPMLSDLISDPGNYYCRNGFYDALNVQAICDKLLHRLLWVKTGNKGSTHDSTAFDGTRLNQESLSK